MMKRLIVRVEDDTILNLSRKQNRTETDMAVMYGVPLDSFIEDIKAEIEKKHLSIIEKNDFDCGRTYGYEECIEIIDKHISEKETKL